MKVVFFVEKFLSPSETFIRNQIEWFDNRHDVFVLCLEASENHHNLSLLPRPNNVVNRISKKFLYISKKNTRTKNALHNYLQDLNPDVIHCHFGIQALSILDNLDPINIPVFVTFHGYDTRKYLAGSSLYRRRWKRLFAIDKVQPIFVCHFHQQLFKLYGIVSKNAQVLHNGVNLEKFKRSSHPQKASFVQVSRFTEKKGHRFTIQAFEIYHKKNPSIPFTLTFLGDGHLLQDIQKLVRSSAIKDFVFFKEWIDNVAEELQKHKYYIQHSITAADGDIEATSISILEAMAMEMPILSTQHAGIPETVKHRENGLLVEERNIYQMAEAIEEIISWDYLKKNRDLVIGRFNLSQRNLTLEKYYYSVL